MTPEKSLADRVPKRREGIDGRGVRCVFGPDPGPTVLRILTNFARTATRSARTRQKTGSKNLSAN